MSPLQSVGFSFLVAATVVLPYRQNDDVNGLELAEI